MSPTRHVAEWRELTGPTYAELGHRETIEWHYHDVHQIVYPSSGVLAISAAAATWVVPPQRAVWIPPGVPHAHQAHGPVRMRTLLPILADDRLRAVAARLRADPADERTLAELGAAAGASERTLSRLFRQETGMSFPQWRTQFRLQHALVLLADRTPVTTTALACGWSNPSAFIDTFRRAFGTTPGRFYSPAR